MIARLVFRPVRTVSIGDHLPETGQRRQSGHPATTAATITATTIVPIALGRGRAGQGWTWRVALHTDWRDGRVVVLATRDDTRDTGGAWWCVDRFDVIIWWLAILRQRSSVHDGRLNLKRGKDVKCDWVSI